MARAEFEFRPCGLKICRALLDGSGGGPRPYVASANPHQSAWRKRPVCNLSLEFLRPSPWNRRAAIRTATLRAQAIFFNELPAALDQRVPAVMAARVFMLTPSPRPLSPIYGTPSC